MLFNSWAFVVFAPIAIFGSRLLRGRAYRLWMVAASYVFYGWAEPWFCFLLLASTWLDYFVAQRIADTQGQRARRLWLITSLVGNLGLLGAFKYTGLIFATINDLAAGLGAEWALPVPDLPLPVGISFYTFQTMSYTIDVYRGKLPPARSFAQFALYVAFFPQLVAGPIERATHLLPQLEDRMLRAAPRTRWCGTTRIFWGLSKKIAFADPIGLYVSQSIADPGVTIAPELLLALTAFPSSIYLDFSAYSDIAIGLARSSASSCARTSAGRSSRPQRRRVLAPLAHLALAPGCATMSSCRWAGRGAREPGTLFNSTLTFFLGGLWHGASWKFAIWGLSIGAMLAIGQGFSWVRGRRLEHDPQRPFHPRQIPAIALTQFGFHVTGIAFVVEDTSHWWQILVGAATHWEGAMNPTLLGETVLRTAALVAFAWVVHFVRGLRWTEPLERIRVSWAHGLLWAACVLTIVMLAPPESERFIYFQF